MSDHIEHACPKCGSLICHGQCEEKKPWPYSGHRPDCKGNCDGACEGAAQKILSNLCYKLDEELKGRYRLWADAQNSCANHARRGDELQDMLASITRELEAYKILIKGSFHLSLNMNDTFGWACADGCDMDEYDVEKVIPLIIKYGPIVLDAYAAVERGEDVMEERRKDGSKYWEAREELKAMADKGEILYSQFFDREQKRKEVEEFGEEITWKSSYNNAKFQSFLARHHNLIVRAEKRFSCGYSKGTVMNTAKLKSGLFALGTNIDGARKRLSMKYNRAP